MIKLAQILLRRNSWVVAAAQAILVSFSFLFSWLLRFDFSLPHRILLFYTLPVLLIVRLVAIWRFGLLHGWWSYTGLSDALDVFKAVLSGSCAFFVLVNVIMFGSAFPRSVYIIEPVLTAGLLIGIRIFSRVLAESVWQDRVLNAKVLVLGAGLAGQTIVREMKRPKSGYSPIGYLDDDPSKHGFRFEGIRVLGPVDSLEMFVQSCQIDEVLIAVPSARGDQMQRFVNICEAAGVKFKTVPALREIINGSVKISHFRDVKVEDLLGRDPVRIDLEAVKKAVQGRVALVTGAAGSIGSELCRQLKQYGPSKLVCIDQNETGMFYLQRELGDGAFSQICCHVANVGDIEPMQKIFNQYRPAMVFHAAAYKHVPLMETNVQEAVRNNIISLLTLVGAAQNSGCANFVLISSDKAVNPTNVMGVTKRIGELIMSCQPRGGMRCSAVRFGNVLGSSGSVVPVLQEQLRNGVPLTITHPDMRRFFMTTQEAVSLVLQAFVLGMHGETLVLDMGTPLRILDLARTLIRLSGKSESEVEIVITGLRDGEKLSEELFYPSEAILPTQSPKIKRACGNSIVHPEELKRLLEELRDSLFVDGPGRIRAKLKEIVPQYCHEVHGEIDVYESVDDYATALGTAD